MLFIYMLQAILYEIIQIKINKTIKTTILFMIFIKQLNASLIAIIATKSVTCQQLARSNSTQVFRCYRVISLKQLLYIKYADKHIKLYFVVFQKSHISNYNYCMSFWDNFFARFTFFPSRNLTVPSMMVLSSAMLPTTLWALALDCQLSDSGATVARLRRVRAAAPRTSRAHRRAHSSSVSPYILTHMKMQSWNKIKIFH